MSKKLFDALRIAAIVIGALGILYGVLADAWGFGYKESVLMSTEGIAAFISTLLQIESKIYFSGKEIVEVDADVDSEAD